MVRASCSTVISTTEPNSLTYRNSDIWPPPRPAP